MVEPASDLLVLLRIRRQLLAAAYVAGGDDWYHVLQKIDANGDGKITRDELATWVRSALPAAQAADKYITALFDLADHDQSGDLSVEELAWLLDSVQDHQQRHPSTTKLRDQRKFTLSLISAPGLQTSMRIPSSRRVFR